MKTKIICFSIIAMLSISCKEDAEILTSEPTAPTEFLSFRSNEEFKLTSNNIANLTNEELDGWEQKKSFVSMRTVLLKAYQEFNTITTEEENLFLLKKYGDILTLRDSTITPYISNTLIQSYVNREGIYKTGKFFNKIVGDFIVTVKEEDFEKLNSFKVSETDFNAAEGVQFTRYNLTLETNGRTKIVGCGLPFGRDQESTFTDDPSGCKNDRRATIRVSGYYNGTELRYRVTIWGQKKNLVCTWVDYSNPLERSSGLVELSLPTEVQYSVPAGSYTGTTFSYDALAANILGFPSGTPVLSGVQIQGKSQGIGNNWAIIDCGI